MSEQPYQPPESHKASFESYVKDEGFTVGNTVTVEAVEGYDPDVTGEGTEADEGFADYGELRYLVEIDTNYKATRTSDYPVRLARTDAAGLAAAILRATEDTFHFARWGRLRPIEAMELLDALREVEHQLSEIREHALGDLCTGVGLGTDPQSDAPEYDPGHRNQPHTTTEPAHTPPADDTADGREPVLDDSEPPETLEQHFADALGALFPAALHEIASSDAYGALKYKVIQRCQDTGETPRQVLNSISPRDRAFAPNANNPAAFLASRID
jgi:hypothetical protein